ncbi:MAG: hypothetical protein AB1567_02465 [bacterium]
MYNWSVDEDRFMKEKPEEFRLWKLTQLINYGLDGERLNRTEVIESWERIKSHIDPYKRRFLEYLLWGKLYSLPNNLTFWNLSTKKNKSQIDSI